VLDHWKKNNRILDFLKPDSGCFQQDQVWGYLSCSRIWIGIGYWFYWINVNDSLLDLYFHGLKQESDCFNLFGIRSGFGFTICETGLEPDSKKSFSQHLCRTPLLFELFNFTAEPRIHWKSAAWKRKAPHISNPHPPHKPSQPAPAPHFFGLKPAPVRKLLNTHN